MVAGLCDSPREEASPLGLSQDRDAVLLSGWARAACACACVRACAWAAGGRARSSREASAPLGGARALAFVKRRTGAGKGN